MRKFYLSFFAISFFLFANGQQINTYLFSASSGTFVPLSGGTPVTSIHGDDLHSSTIPLGFNFSYGGTVYNSVSANSNGWLTFNPSPTTSTSNMRTNNFTTTNTGLHPILAPLWDDLEGTNDITPTPAASYQTSGAPGNQVFTFEWLNWTRFAQSTSNISFQVKLYEASGVIEFYYRQEANTSNFAGASIGISNSATDFLSLSDAGVTPTASSTTSTNNITARPATGQVYTFSPPLPCVGTPVPGTINGDATLCTGLSTTLTLSGTTSATGLSYQWLSSTGGGPFLPIAGATNNSYTTPALTTTTSYAVTVSCGASNATTTPFTVTVPPLFPGGTYTIDGSNTTGGTNFQTFADAINAIRCGIAGAVVFNVAAGIYDEQISIPQIGNASTTNTITFNGQGVATIQQAPVTGLRHIIQLDGADYVTIKNMNILVQSGFNYGWGIHLTNGADFNRIDSNTIDVTNVTSTTQSNSAGIVVSGSGTSVTTDGSASNNIFSNNTIIGAYQSIIITGTATSQNAVNNQILNNTLRDFYADGIELTDTDGSIVLNNDINRANRGAVGTFAGIELSGGNINAVINSNRIHDTHNIASSQTGTAYGIYFNGNDAPAGSENKVINNLIYNFNSGSGIQYGIYNSSSNGVRYFHNTIVLNDAATSSNDATRGFYQTTAASNIEFRNNIVYVTRGGTGEKHAVYFATTTSSIISNNNVLFVNATPGFVGAFGTTDYATLADWQTANSGAYDQQSLSVDPVFADPANGVFYPNNSGISAIGTPVGVTTDIVGTPRDATFPTPGAYEIVASVGVDVGAVELFVPAQQDCYTSAETVTVTIRNYSASTHNFLSSPVTINASVTGPNATTFAPVIINSGTLAPDATLNVVISNNYNMSTPGIYEFNATTTIGSDANALNDAMPAQQRTVEALEAGTLSSNPPNYCVTGGIPVLTLDGSSGGPIQWQQSPTGTPGSWVNVGTNDTTYSPAAAITADMYYRAYVTCTTNSDTSNVVTVAVFNPTLLTTTPGTRCGPGTVTLNATAGPGYGLNWYADATGGAPVATGTTFTTPVLNTNTTYYVSATSGGISGTVGAPNTSISTSLSSQTTTTAGINFDVEAPNFRINSLDIYPTAAIGSSFTIVVRQGTTEIASYTGTTTVQGSTTAPVVQTVPVNFNIPVGTGYRITMSTNPGVIRNSGGVAFPYSLPGTVTLTSSTGTGFYYYMYNWQVSTGCETSRTAVTATITPAPAFDVTNSTTICNNAIIPLQVNSSLASYDNYTWSPVTGLYTDPGATVPYTGGTASIVFAKTGTAGTYTYVATANNSVTNCQNIDSLQLTVLPATVTVSAMPAEICVSGSTTLSYAPFEGFGAAEAQWFSSADGVTFTPITNATGVTYTTPNLTTTTYYRLVIEDGSGNSCLQQNITVNVNNPLLLTSTPATRCGAGTLDLNATSSTGATINWYTSPIGGLPVATGPLFTTPVLNTTTTYYVAASSGSSAELVGKTAPTSTTNTNGDDWGLVFDVVNTPIVINTVDVYSVAASGGSITVKLTNSSGTVITTAGPFTFPSGSTASPTLFTLPLNIAVPVGTGYRLLSDNMSGNLIRETTGNTYPYVSPSGNVEITSGYIGGTSNTYYWFYNWQVTAGCESARVAVEATVSPNTGILTQPVNKAVCTGANVMFTVGAEGANLTFQWKKGGVDIPNATNDTLILNAVTPAEAGTYSVAITGLCGNATSNEVTLTVANNNAWLGVVSNDWNTPGNWCGGVPTSTSDVVITAGTPYAPVVNGIANVRNLSVNTGTSLSVAANAFLNIYGDYSNSGTFSAPSGFVAFKGAANQNISSMTAGTVIMNGTGGITLAGTMTVDNALVLTNGNITLGTHNLVLNGGSAGSATSHVITNGTGSVISNNINAGPVTVPVGPNATSYNPVIISNGQGRDYTVRVAPGISPSINNPNRAINRTWYVMPSTPVTSPVNLVFQFVDADMNNNASATLVMEAAVHNGTSWTVVSPATGVTPSGTPNDRQVGINTTVFGPTAIGNFGAITFPTATANVDADVTSLVMMPNLVRDQTVLRVSVRRTMKINWSVVDASGRIVMTFTKQVHSGQNDIQLQLGHLAQGAYQIVGSTEKGKTGVLKFVKM